MPRPFAHTMFLDQARRHPDRVAVAARTRSVTYGELARASAGVTRALQEEGIEAGSIVAVAATDRSELTAAIVGVLGAGCAFMALDLQIPQRRLHAMLELAPPVCVLAPAGVREGLDPLAALRWIELPAAVPGPPGAERLEPSRPRDEDELAYVVFTSGSTGRPKAIAGRLSAIDHFVRWEIGELGVGDGWRVSQLTSPAFDAVLRDLFVPLGAGGTVCAPPEGAAAQDGDRLARWIADERLDLVHCVPSVFRLLLEGAGDHRRFPALRYLLLAGESVFPSDVRAWFETQGSQTRLLNLYGPSETTMTKLVHVVTPEDAERARIPVGRAMPGAAVAVLDSRGRPCAGGSIGEIYIRTPYRSLGYLNRPDLTEEVFITNPLTGDPADVVYRTGDFGRILPDGAIEFLGRRDGQVKVRGVRVETGDVEAALRELREVRDVAVVAREDRSGAASLVAYVVMHEKGDPARLRDRLAERLPAAMVPSAFLSMEKLPRTHTGKLDRRALPAPESPDARRGRSLRPARTPIEELLSQHWAEVLGLERVGVDESFFALGGHSLLATRLLSRLRRTLGLEIELTAFFEAPTVEGLAKRVEARLRGVGGRDGSPEPSGQWEVVPRRSPTWKAPRNGDRPASLRQERLWHLARRGSPAAERSVAAAVQIVGDLETARLASALDVLARRHEALRTTLDERAGRVIQVVRERGGVVGALLDLGQLDRRRAWTEVERAARLSARARFDLATGPLARFTLVRLDDGRHVLILVAHEAVADGASLAILAAEVIHLYQGDGGADLEDPLVQFADFAARERRLLEGGFLDPELEYWRGRLSRPAPRVVVGGVEAGATSGAGSHSVARELSAARVRSLRELGARTGATLFMTALAAFVASLHDLGGARTLEIGVPVDRRDQDGLHGLVGPVSNFVSLRIDTGTRQSFIELVEQVRAVTMEAVARRTVPFEAVLREVDEDRYAGREPDFQVTCNLVRPGFAADSQSSDRRVRVEPVALPIGALRSQLDLHLVETADGLRARLDWRPGLLDEEDAAALLERWTRLLAAAPSGQDARLSELVPNPPRTTRKEALSNARR